MSELESVQAELAEADAAIAALLAEKDELSAAVAEKKNAIKALYEVRDPLRIKEMSLLKAQSTAPEQVIGGQNG